MTKAHKQIENKAPARAGIDHNINIEPEDLRTTVAQQRPLPRPAEKKQRDITGESCTT
jgi:hypothetical protein